MSSLFAKILKLGISVPALMFLISLFLTLFFLSHLLITKTETLRINNYILLLSLIAAFFSYVGNLFYVKSIGLATNPGYPVAVNGLQAVIITMVSVLLFQAEITLLKGVGICFAVLAVILLAIY